MKSDDMPMWNDPGESALVRDLLQAGRNAPLDYDAAQGLAQHLAQVQAGAPMPHWAHGGAAAGTSTAAVVSWVVLPVLTASVAAAVWFSTRDTAPTQPSAAVAAPVAIHAPVLPAASVRTEALEAAHPTDPTRTVTDVTPREEASPTSIGGREARREAGLARVQSPTPRAAHKATVAQPHTRAVQPRSIDELLAAAESSANAPRPSNAVAARDPSSPSAAPPAAGASTTNAQAASAAEVDAPEAAQPAAVEPTRAQASDSRLEREMQMLAVAQRVLGDDPSRALRLAEQGDREFPGSMFAAERKNVALLALVKLGRLDEARRAGRPFLAKYPNAPFSERLRRALVTGSVD